MKLLCEVEVSNRTVSNINGVSTKRRSAKSTLVLGKEPKNDKAYFILHFSSVNKVGTRFKVNENIEQVFTKFYQEGKATIRFKNPPTDLCIKNSDSNQLKYFLKCLKLVLDGNVQGLKLLNLSNISATSIKPPPTKLCITDISQYPLKGLPRTLEHLEVCEIGMNMFRREILSLKNLKHLDMNGNKLKKLPKEFGTLPNLSHLNLSRNLFGCAEEPDWRWLEGSQLCKKLSYLDLSGNSLGPLLPCALSKLCRLTTLHLQDNNIETLPHGLARIDTLRYLNLSRNKLSSLPGCIRMLRLDELDVSGNNIEDMAAQEHLNQSITLNNTKLRIGSLVEMSGAAVLNNHIYYTKGMIPLTLVHFLNTCKYCVCGKVTFNESNYVTERHSLKRLFHFVIFDNLTEEMNFDCYFCSYKCFRNKSTFFA